MPVTRMRSVAVGLYGRKPVRYAMVSACAVAWTQALLFVFNTVLQLPPVQSNVFAVVISSWPSYVLNRVWVWGRRGGHDLWREVFPFWSMALLGLALSTLFVHFASEYSTAPLVANLANLAAFGLLWVVKYLLLDTVLFGRPLPDEDGEELAAA